MAGIRLRPGAGCRLTRCDAGDWISDEHALVSILDPDPGIRISTHAQFDVAVLIEGHGQAGSTPDGDRQPYGAHYATDPPKTYHSGPPLVFRYVHTKR